MDTIYFEDEEKVRKKEGFIKKNRIRIGLLY